MKKILGLLAIIMSVVFVKNVYAEVYYTNANGVVFDQNQYNYISELYWDGYQNYMTQNDFNMLYNNDIFGQHINRVSETYYNNQNPIGVNSYGSITEMGRTLTISSSCSSICTVVMNVTWNGSASVKSYDVIGARYINTSIVNTGTTIVTGTGYSQGYGTPQTFNNGFGYSVQYPNANNVQVTTTFYTNPSGSIRGSYQHAMSNVSLATSKKYTISSVGLGGVFNFYGAAIGKYDGANGLTLTL